MKKLNKSDFFDMYVISALNMSDIEIWDQEVLVDRMNEVACKYTNITLFAVQAEARYARSGGYSYDSETTNANHLKNLKINPKKIHTRNERAKIDFKKAHAIFAKINWDSEYGGRAWAQIAKAGAKLELLLPCKRGNVAQVCSAIDRLNDLEHNNALYLQTYSSFSLVKALDEKANARKTVALVSRCSGLVRQIVKEYRFQLK